MDVLDGPPSTRLVFYGPSSLRVYAVPLLQQGETLQLEAGDEDEEDTDAGNDSGSSSSNGNGCSSSNRSTRAGPLLCQESVEARGGLVPHDLRVSAPPPSAAPLADIAVSGLPGWVAVHAPYARRDVLLRVWAPRGVEVFLRPPLPCAPPPRPQLLPGAARRGGAADGAAGLGAHAADADVDAGPPELAELAPALEAAEADAEWVAHRAALGLADEKLSPEDEAVLRMLLFGDEEAGLEGIVDHAADDDDDDDDGGSIGVSRYADDSSYGPRQQQQQQGAGRRGRRSTGQQMPAAPRAQHVVRRPETYRTVAEEEDDGQGAEYDVEDGGEEKQPRRRARAPARTARARRASAMPRVRRAVGVVQRMEETGR